MGQQQMSKFGCGCPDETLHKYPVNCYTDNYEDCYVVYRVTMAYSYVHCTSFSIELSANTNTWISVSALIVVRVKLSEYVCVPVVLLGSFL